ncbi:MAG: peptidylprolyl isomerase [Chthoniobacter sp.]|nr:peptidylprolyl isomerase [Chthoniobacter sp.]
MKNTSLSLALLFALCVAVIGRAENPHGLPDGLYTEITTERGVVVCELFYEKVPMTVINHICLAEGRLGPKPRKPFYDGLTWCRVVPGLVVQGGDPKGTGEGDAGYLFPDEIVPGLRHDGMGTLQMGNDGPDTNGSQFCLMLSAQHRLNYQHNVFGRVVRGMELLPEIKQGDTMRVKILRLGPAAQAFRADEATFKALVERSSRYSGPREPGPDAPFADPEKILPTEWDRAKHFNYKLVNFERFTGTKLAARVYAQPPAEAVGDKLNAWLTHEAARLGVAKRGALAIYFAQPDQWHIRIGTDSVAHFLETDALGEKSTPSSSVEEAVRQLLAAATTRSAESIAAIIKRLPPEDPMTDGRRIKLKTDAVLDGLIFKLEKR